MMFPAVLIIAGCPGRASPRLSACLRVVLSVVILLMAFPLRAQVPLEIRVEGVRGELRTNVLAHLSLYRERADPLLSSYRVERLHRRAEDEIRRALRPFGYYEPQISSELEPLDGGWRATYRVAAGEPVRVGEVNIRISGEGAADPRLRQWQEEFPLAPGQVLRHPQYDTARESLLGLAQDRGYLEGELLTREIRVNVGERRADLVLEFETGPRYSFGTIAFEETPLRESFLERFLPFQPGEPYDADRMFELQRAMVDSDYFERVDVVPEFDAIDGQRVPIRVGIEMRPRNRYTAGAGYGTDTGPRLSLGAERRWANSRGHRMGANLLWSDVNQDLTTYYRIPLDNPTSDYLGLATRWEQEETEDTVRSTTSAVVSLTHLLQNWQRTWALNLQRERFEVAAESDQSSMIFPSLGLQRVAATERIFPLRGWRFAGEVRVASESLFSATDLTQGLARGKRVWPLLGGRLISRAEVGISEVGDFDVLPVSLRFFAGGDQSVRGYSYRSLGPENEAGEVTGGRHLLVGSIEYDRYLSERTGVAVFYDAGNAFNDLSDYELNHGVGVGARWRLPFGIIRLDVAAAVSESGTPWRLHLTIGPEL